MKPYENRDGNHRRLPTRCAKRTAVGILGRPSPKATGQKGHTEIYRAEYAVSFLPKIKIEVAVATDTVDKAVEAVISAAKAGQIGDGKVFVFPLDRAVRIRTGETDADAPRRPHLFHGDFNEHPNQFEEHGPHRAGGRAGIRRHRSRRGLRPGGPAHR